MANLLHYTLNSGDVFDCRAKKFQGAAIIQNLRTQIQEFVVDGAGILPLPHPFEAYRAKTTITDGAALFDLLDPQGLPLTVNAVAWTSQGQIQVWQEFENLYLKLAREFQTLSVSRAPVVPNRLPWLTTLIIPNPNGFGLTWIADFEQCYTLALLPERRPKGGQGFGKSPE